jgi:hypothetical protein
MTKMEGIVFFWIEYRFAGIRVLKDDFALSYHFIGGLSIEGPRNSLFPLLITIIIMMRPYPSAIGRPLPIDPERNRC